MPNEFSYRERNLTKQKQAKTGSSGMRRKFSNYKFALGMGMNWVDLDKGVIYHIQEYRDAWEDRTIPQDKKPNQIRMTDLKTNQVIGWADPEIVAERMKDPEPDPCY